jgi:predicted nucleotidyltransferase component of viral defense system
VIPRANVTAWRAHAPWPTDAQVEHDLVLSRVLVQIFQHEDLTTALAFRGGTAIHKLLLPMPLRYSEDIDLIQTAAGPSKPMIGGLRSALDPWLGPPRWSVGANTTTLDYRFDTTALPVQTMRLKIETNTREHFAVMGYVRRPFAVNNPWFKGSAEVQTFRAEELLGTKLRALYQRSKGRDLFDLDRSLDTLNVDDARIVECFGTYLRRSGLSVTRAQFEANLEAKLEERSFRDDVRPLLSEDARYDAAAAAAVVVARLLSRLQGPSGQPPRDKG